MSHDQIEHSSEEAPVIPDALIPRMRAYLSSLPELRLAYFQPGPAEAQMPLAGPDTARVVLVFTRNVSGEHIEKRLGKIRKHFAGNEAVEFLDIEHMDYREACEMAFNGQLVYGGTDTAERDRLYRYNVFLEWNASRRISGVKQEQPPQLAPSLDRPLWVVSIPKFITPIYRHLKMIESHLRELRRITQLDLSEFGHDTASKSLAESYILKSVQSAILITMSVMHRKMRLSARDYRDLFLHMPVFGLATRERAAKLSTCAEIRDRLMFQYEEVTAIEVYENARQIIEIMQDFKAFMLEWLFEHYYGPSGELIQTE